MSHEDRAPACVSGAPVVPACLGRTCAGLARGDVLMLILLAAFVALTTGFVAGCAFMWALPT